MIKILSFFFVLIFSTSVNSATLLIIGDSLSAGYKMDVTQSWPYLLNEKLSQKQQNKNQIINSSISGDTSGNGLARLPNLLRQHKPDLVLIELGANDGLRGFNPSIVSTNIEKIIQSIQAEGAKTLLMQINVPTNYGKRYSQLFSRIYPKLSEKYNIPLLPFFLVDIFTNNPQWIMEDGLHPKPIAQGWIATFMASKLTPYLD